MAGMATFLVGLLALTIFGQNHLAHCNEEFVLSSKLLSNYRRVNGDLVGRPVLNWTSTVNVTLGLLLYEVISYDEITNKATFSLAEYQAWSDPLLTWYPEDYGGVRELRIPANLIWKPDIMLENKVTAVQEVDSAVNVLVTSTGNVIYVPPAIRTVTCSPDPISIGTVYCSMYYGSWTYDILKVNVDLMSEDGVDLTETNMKTDWVVHSVSAHKDIRFFRYECCPGVYPSIRFFIDLSYAGSLA